MTEASGQVWGVTLATLKRSSPLQAIEKKQLKSVPIWMLARQFGDGQAFGRNRKLLGNLAVDQTVEGEHFDGTGCI